MKESTICPLCGYLITNCQLNGFYVVAKGKPSVKQWYHKRCFDIEKDRIDEQRKNKGVQ